MVRIIAAAGLILCFVVAAPAAPPAEVKIGYLRQPEPKITISLLDQPAANDGFAGAELAVADNNTTGKFFNQKYSLEDVRLDPGADPVAAINALADKGIHLVIADLEPDPLLKAADAGKAKGVLLFNAGASDDRLREDDCRADVIHVAPTRSMLADGLGQYLIWKQWRRWFLVFGSHEKDKLFADALRRSAKRFGGKIVEEREFKDTGGARRSDTGIVQVQGQMSSFTQEAPAYDVLLAADESEVFAGFLPYHTWDPRPVAGSAGLVPTSWDASAIEWGGIQLQNRFQARYRRGMTARDMQAWTAARMIGEAVTRTGSTEAGKLLEFMKGPDFALAAFKGQKLTLRDWNLQLRQPILLSDGKHIVSVSPQKGFLHPVSELDTLGYDRPETKCKLQ